MEVSGKKTVIHSKLETNIIAAIEHLLLLRKKNGVKANLLTLCKELGISSIDYSLARTKQRGFSKAKIPGIVGKLQNTFGVKKEFLYNGKPPILEMLVNEEYGLQDDGGGVSYQSMQQTINEQQKQIAQLKRELEDKMKIIATQDLAIEAFKALRIGKN